ncbi:TPA: hypothetical protein N2D99_002177 [Clostridium botulinum]|nr:hypothetical protein [Clostridium botulinum]
MKILIDFSSLQLNKKDAQELFNAVGQKNNLKDNEVLDEITMNVDNIDKNINNIIKSVVSIGLDVVITK